MRAQQIAALLLVITIWTGVILTVCPIVVTVADESDVPTWCRPVVLKPGQVWWMGQDDPFAKPIGARIVQIKDGYVRYYFAGQEKYGEWAMTSSSVGNFRTSFRHQVPTP